ncbi:MAG: glycoside hydrolase family 32 protein [Eubacteriales bacterium]|nr:glycoside hydrolase family 32 protein [Eubacteriales bacterium]
MYTGSYKCLELFARPVGEQKGFVSIIADDGGEMERRELEHLYGNWLRIPVAEDTAYQVELKDAEVTLAYLSDTEDILDTGICILDAENGFEEMDEVQFREFIQSSYREKYHFSPVINWMNDPNGLCWYQGYYHMFYQFNPFGQEWNNMYWGHAASTDLVHWKHLPVVLEPQKEILDNLQIKGGAFSGSALAGENEARFWLTRHIGPHEDGEETVQYQTEMRSSDMIHFSEERTIIKEKPEGTNFDFRDPKAGKFGDEWYLVLGACVNGKGTFLLYESQDQENWTYKCPLLTENESIRTIECPDFFPLDGKYVAMGAWMNHYDEEGRFQMSRYYIGNWEGADLQIESEQWVDFGSNCYAVQSFCHEGRRIAIGWISDFYGEHIAVKNGAYGSMTLPRELHVRENRVYTQPVKEVYDLKDKLLYSGKENALKLENIPDNCYYAKISGEMQGDFSILLGKDKDKTICLKAEGGTLFLKTSGVKSEAIRFVSSVRNFKNAEIFVDGRTVEVYLNDGEDVGTKLFYNSQTEGCFELASRELLQVEIYTMKSIW